MEGEEGRRGRLRGRGGKNGEVVHDGRCAIFEDQKAWHPSVRPLCCRRSSRAYGQPQQLNEPRRNSTNNHENLHSPGFCPARLTGSSSLERLFNPNISRALAISGSTVVRAVITLTMSAGMDCKTDNRFLLSHFDTNFFYNSANFCFLIGRTSWTMTVQEMMLTP